MTISNVSPAEVPVCEMCRTGRHSHCAGLRFTVSGIPFKPDPSTACSCHECDRLRERWIFCDRCKTELAPWGEKTCRLCRKGTPSSTLRGTP